MSQIALLLTIVGLLTLIGSAALFFVTYKYYWGDRGTPPPTGEQRRAMKEEELRLRARQLERARRTPVRPRPESFFDNRKS